MRQYSSLVLTELEVVLEIIIEFALLLFFADSLKFPNGNKKSEQNGFEYLGDSAATSFSSIIKDSITHKVSAKALYTGISFI